MVDFMLNLEQKFFEFESIPRRWVYCLATPLFDQRNLVVEVNFGVVSIV